MDDINALYTPEYSSVHTLHSETRPYFVCSKCKRATIQSMSQDNSSSPSEKMVGGMKVGVTARNELLLEVACRAFIWQFIGV